MTFWQHTSTSLAWLLTRPANSAAMPEWMVTTYSIALDWMNTRLTTSPFDTGRLGVKWSRSQAQTTSGCFYPRSNHWEVGGRPQCDKCGCRVRIAHSIVSRLWRQFQTTGTAIRGFSSGRPRETTPADDRYIALQARRNRRQTAGKSLDTRHRRLDDRYRVLPWPEDRTVVVCLNDALERGSHNHPSNIIERDRYGGRGVLVWGGIMLGSRTDLHIFDAGSVNGTRYCNEILLPYVRLFRGAMGLQFLFMDDNAPCHRTVAAEQLL
ncbi:transposable element Tcb1 transposase [Trichonephila clavipes]|nr:transposable element Tcb1 transposase [Trichonephila clavipes]